MSRKSEHTHQQSQAELLERYAALQHQFGTNIGRVLLRHESTGTYLLAPIAREQAKWTFKEIGRVLYALVEKGTYSAVRTQEVKIDLAEKAVRAAMQEPVDHKAVSLFTGYAGDAAAIRDVLRQQESEPAPVKVLTQRHHSNELQPIKPDPEITNTSPTIDTNRIRDIIVDAAEAHLV